jgi:hypothetical protein
MDRTEVLLKILDLAKPVASNPDIGQWLARATRLEAYVLGAGHTDKVPADPKTIKAPTTKARTPAE